MRHGQVALEYLVIISIALLLSSPLIVQAQESSQSLQDSYQNGLAKNALNNIEEAAALVNAQGPPAKVTFSIRLPDRIIATNVSGSQIMIRREVGAGSTTFRNTMSFTVNGSLPTTGGVHTMVAEAEPSYVNITPQ
ncbi:MAG: hypothetical protein SVW77_03350 [Candidatus Nanohaloarchaea archaeon]|nr:hypothetical protein [Candidatus Nanohaloarchaea archaeon]